MRLKCGFGNSLPEYYGNENSWREFTKQYVGLL
jgi:hypothetical protein